MRRAKRLHTAVDERRALLALGALYVALAVGHPFLPSMPDVTTAEYVVVLVPAGGAGVAVAAAGYWLPRLDVAPACSGVVARWCLRGIGAMVLLVGLVAVLAGVTNVVQNLLILTAIGAVAGLVAGVYDARAKSRQLELRRTVERLERANDRLSEFTYATSHDLQEPLRMVSSYLRLLDSRYADDLDEEAREYVDFAVDGADRMRAMVASLHEYSQATPTEEPHDRVDAAAVLDDVLDDLEPEIEEADATVTVDELPTVTADARQLAQLFRNLLSNALRYSGDEAPRVHVGASPSEAAVDAAPEAGVDAEAGTGTAPGAGVDADTGASGGPAGAEKPRPSTDEWCFSVADDGVGIDPEYHDRLFGAFEQFHASDGPGPEAGGTGLALCERIVERHGGDIWVDSTPDEGSTFYFTLPAAERGENEVRPVDQPIAE